MSKQTPEINLPLVKNLIGSQFPAWSNESITAVQNQGWDNRTFRLGVDKSIRLPSAEQYQKQIHIEYEWLPRLAKCLSFAIPSPIALGKPEHGYPWHWSINRWLEGACAATCPMVSLPHLALDLAESLAELRNLKLVGGPAPGPDNFYRGGDLSHYDTQTTSAIEQLHKVIDCESVWLTWKTALNSSLEGKPVWIHGDIAPGNLILKDGHLSGLIDFGLMAIGDPACDLVINWTLFHGESRAVFEKETSIEPTVWQRARGWALWKALITAVSVQETNLAEWEKQIAIISDVCQSSAHSENERYPGA